jgi:hypothetical protein
MDRFALPEYPEFQLRFCEKCLQKPIKSGTIRVGADRVG